MLNYTVYKCKGCDKGPIAMEKIRDYYDYTSIQVYGCRWCGYSDSLEGKVVASGEGSIPNAFREKMYWAGTRAALGPHGEQYDRDMFRIPVGKIQCQPPKGK